MKTQAERRLGLGLAALLMTLIWGAATPATSRAAPMYSITDLGTANDPTLANWPKLDPTFSDPLTISGDGQPSSYSTANLASGGMVFSSGSTTVVDRALSFATGNLSTGAYLQVSGQQQLIMPPGASTSTALGVSSTGYVVGWSNSPTMPGFVYSASRGFVDLSTGNLQPGPLTFGGLSHPSPFEYYGINAQNQVVGSYSFGNDGKYGVIGHAFIASLDPTSPFHGGVDLNTLIPPTSGWTLISATGINDAGQVVGYGIDPEGRYSGYELMPVSRQVPEPSVLAFFGTVCLGMAVRAAVRRRCQGGGL